MTPAEIALEALAFVAKVAPGYLALILAKPTDAEALEHARQRILAVPTRPAGDAIDDEVHAAAVAAPHATLDGARKP